MRKQTRASDSDHGTCEPTWLTQGEPSPAHRIVYARSMQILQGFCTLLLFQFAGMVLKAGTRSQLPGPVIGMALLALWLLFRSKQPQESLERAAGGLLSVLGLLFVPAGVGIMVNLAILRSAWLPLTVSLVGSTLISLAATAWVMSSLQRRRSRLGAL